MGTIQESNPDFISQEDAEIVGAKECCEASGVPCSIGEVNCALRKLDVILSVKDRSGPCIDSIQF